MRHCPIALVVSADRHVRQLIATSLGDLGCTTLRAENADEGRRYAALTHMDVVVVDALDPHTPENDLVRELRMSDPDVKVLYLVEQADGAPVADSVGGARDTYLSKPFRMFELSDVLEDLLDDHPAFLPATRVSLN